MNKVLLIYEDYTELNTVQFTLKKVGFDCLGIGTEFGTSEKVISFNPDIVIACGKGPKVSTVGVGRRLKDMPRWTGKAVLIFAPGNKPKPEDLMKIRMDVVLEAPVENVRLIQVLAKLTNQDDQVLVEKLIKTMAQENVAKDPSFVIGSKPANEKVFVGGGAENRDSDEITTRVSSFDNPSSENSETVTESTVAPASSSSAFDDLNRREKAKAARRPQFSLTPEIDPEDPTETRFDYQSEKNQATSAQLEFQKKAEERIRARAEAQLREGDLNEVKSSADLPIDKQQVDWSEVEKQLFKGASEPQKTEALVQEDHPGAKDIPLDPASPNFAQQVRAAEGRLAVKMKEYQEMTRSLKLAKESTLKKTDSRKAQIELMKDWKQAELEKQDDLRREFTKALFKKK